jgi:hypothetical protein
VAEVTPRAPRWWRTAHGARWWWLWLRVDCGPSSPTSWRDAGCSQPGQPQPPNSLGMPETARNQASPQAGAGCTGCDSLPHARLWFSGQGTGRAFAAAVRYLSACCFCSCSSNTRSTHTHDDCHRHPHHLRRPCLGLDFSLSVVPLAQGKNKKLLGFGLIIPARAFVALK